MTRLIAGICCLLLALAATAAHSAELATSDRTSGTFRSEPRYAECTWISQNHEPWSVGNTQFACDELGAGWTTENWWGRQFFLLEDHWLSGEVGVSQVAFGVETCTDNFTIHIRLYRIPNTHGVGITFGDLEYLGSEEVAIGPANDMSIVYVDFANPCFIDADNWNYVVAIDAPHGEGAGPGHSNIMFWSGANGFGALMDSYFAAASCGIYDPVPVSAVGFPNAQTILNLCVREAGDPIPARRADWGAIKLLYR